MTGIVRNSVRDKLARGEVVASMTARLVRSVEIASLAKAAGFDTLYVDLEHNSFSLDATSQICITALAVGIAPFVAASVIKNAIGALAVPAIRRTLDRR